MKAPGGALYSLVWWGSKCQGLYWYTDGPDVSLSLSGARLGKNQALLPSCVWACHLTPCLTFVICKRGVNFSAQRWQSVRAVNKAPESSVRTQSLALPLSGPGVLGRFLNDSVSRYFRQQFWGQ